MENVVFLKIQDRKRILRISKHSAPGFTFESQLDFFQKMAKEFPIGELLREVCEVAEAMTVQPLFVHRAFLAAPQYFLGAAHFFLAAVHP